MFDVSGSLGIWHGEVKAALVQSLPLISFGVDTVSIASFQSILKALQAWTTEKGDVKSALGKLVSGGSTDLSSGIDGTNSLMAMIPGNPTCKSALVVTDGQASCPAQSKLQLAQTNGWKYTFLGVGNQNAKEFNCMATGSGATSLSPPCPAMHCATHLILDYDLRANPIRINCIY